MVDVVVTPHANTTDRDPHSAKLTIDGGDPTIRSTSNAERNRHAHLSIRRLNGMKRTVPSRSTSHGDGELQPVSAGWLLGWALRPTATTSSLTDKIACDMTKGDYTYSASVMPAFCRHGRDTHVGSAHRRCRKSNHRQERHSPSYFYRSQRAWLVYEHADQHHCTGVPDSIEEAERRTAHGNQTTSI